VAAANVLAAPLADPGIGAEALTPLLARVERRRLFPTRVTQAAQVAVQNRLLAPVLAGGRRQPLSVPWPVKLLNRWPVLRVLPAYAVGVGVRPEHVRSPSVD
jgi:hypothetical protein